MRRLGRWAAVIQLAWLFACTTETATPTGSATGSSGTPSATGSAVGSGGSTGSGSTGAGGSGAGGSGAGLAGQGGATIADAAADNPAVLDAEPRDGGPGPSDGAVGAMDSTRSDANRPADAAQGAPDADAATLPARVLLYHFSTAVIDTVPAQLTFFKNKLTEWGFESEDSVDPSKFTDANLMRYAAVAMVNTCFFPFGAGQPDRPSSEALQRFVQRGGGLFGNHCAAVTFANAQPPALYNQLFGGRGGNGFFDGRSDCRKTADHATTAALPATWVFNGNLDNADFVATDSVVLVRCTWSTGKEVAVSWYRTEGAGRVFYTNFAKLEPDLRDPVLGAGHIIPGLAWVLKR